MMSQNSNTSWIPKSVKRVISILTIKGKKKELSEVHLKIKEIALENNEKTQRNFEEVVLRSKNVLENYRQKLSEDIKSRMLEIEGIDHQIEDLKAKKRVIAGEINRIQDKYQKESSSEINEIKRENDQVDDQILRESGSRLKHELKYYFELCEVPL